MEQPDLFDVCLDDQKLRPANGSIDDDIDDILRFSERVYHTICNAQMNETLLKNDLNDYIKKIICASRQTGPKAAQYAIRSATEKAAFDRGDPLVRTILAAAYKVEREIHRLIGLLRFNPRSDGIWLARCAPDNFILPAFAEYFTARFGEAPWAIIDEKRELVLVRLEGKAPCFGMLSAFPFLLDHEMPPDNWEELWRSYHRSINIENRKNPTLQLQFMPRRYWKYLPELN